MRQVGFGMTDIDPFWHPSPQGRTMFDVGRVAQQDGEAIAERIAPVMANLLLAATGACTGLCEARAPGFACICSQNKACTIILWFIIPTKSHFCMMRLTDRRVGSPPAVSLAQSPLPTAIMVSIVWRTPS